jgi:uncharacterized protein YqcC (DUF446 family)
VPDPTDRFPSVTRDYKPKRPYFHEFREQWGQTRLISNVFQGKPIEPGRIGPYNRAMHDIPDRIADVLLEVEANLRNSGRWDPDRPPKAALDSSEPFCLDTLRFEQWLQWVFLPRMKQILEYRRPLPAKSAIFTYAQEYLRKTDPLSSNLLSLIKRFDDLIAIQAGARAH